MSRDTISRLGLMLEGAASITLDHSVTLDQRIRRLLRDARRDARRDAGRDAGRDDHRDAGRDDRTALMQDWERVGDDMRKAISIIEVESVKERA